MSTAPCPEPSRALLADLRTEVGRFRAGQVRRRFPAGLHAGAPAGPRVSTELADLRSYDAGLRADVAARLLDLVPSDVPAACCAWLTRPGDTEPQDCDVAWLAAADTAFAMHGLRPAGFYVVTRTGWLDPRSGERRVWKRLRLRPQARGGPQAEC